MTATPTTTGLFLFNIRDYGATGNAQSLDTAAIQRAVDACAASGGGVVYCPPGTYLTGTVFLTSHVELHLETGATLLGSPARADYIRMFQLVARGTTKKESADRLTISEWTVRRHVQNILGKLHLANRTQATIYALREDLADGEPTCRPASLGGEEARQVRECH